MGTPTIPNILYVPLAEENQISIWWSPPSSGTPLSYRITLNPGSIIQTIPGTWQEYTFSGLVAGTEYTATIAATNDGSTYGPVATFFPVTPDGIPLAPPQNASAIPSGSNAIFITWSPPAVLPASPIDAYVITGTSTSPNVSTITYTQPTSGGTSALIQNITPGVAYTFTIQAVNDVGFSPLATTNSVLVSATESYGIPDWAVPTFANINAGGNNFRNIFNCIACDTQNNIYIAGQCFNSTLNLFNYHSTLGNGIISTTTAGVFVSTGIGTITNPFTYIIKYTSSGNVSWFTPIQPLGNFSARPSGLITDNNNNVYISHEIAQTNGFRYYNAQIPGLSGRISTGTLYGTIFLSNTTSAESVLAKYNSDGVVQWVTPISGLETQTSQQRNSLVADSQNNIYSLFYSSNFTSTIFNSAAGVTAGGIIRHSTVARLVGELDTTWANQNILAKYDTDGQFQWATKSPCYFQANQQTLAIDSNDNVFMGANLSTPSTVVFNYAGISSGIISTSIYGRILKDSRQVGLDGLVIKYNSNGQAQWIIQQNCSTANTSFPPRAIATDIYGNLFTAGQQNTNAPLVTFRSFQRVTNDLYISTVSSAVINNTFNFVAKYDSNGQFITLAGQHPTGGVVSQDGFPNLMTDYNGNVYYVLNDSTTQAGAAASLFDFLSKDSDNFVTYKQYGRVAYPFIPSGTYGVGIRKFNTNLETQYYIRLSNTPLTLSTSVTASNICIDRNNYLYIAGNAIVSSLLGVPTQSSIPLPQWNGVAGGPYSWTTTTIIPATVSISSIITSTTTYSVLVKYK
jgi:hypothetical protein